MKSKGRPCRVTTFIYNGFTSAVSSGTVNQRYPGTVTCAYAAAYRITFGAELGEVFILYIPCASHQPAAFCCFRCEITYSLHCICLFRYFALYIIGLISSIGFYRWSVSFSFSSDLRSRYFLVANRHAIATTLISVSTGE